MLSEGTFVAVFSGDARLRPERFLFADMKEQGGRPNWSAKTDDRVLTACHGGVGNILKSCQCK
jgi:hypothetical protein